MARKDLISFWSGRFSLDFLGGPLKGSSDKGLQSQYKFLDITRPEPEHLRWYFGWFKLNHNFFYNDRLF